MRPRPAVVAVVVGLLGSLVGVAGADAVAPAGASAAVVPPRMECAALTGREIAAPAGESAAIDTAEVVPATGGSAEYCRVIGVISPQHQFEVRLPTATWTQRYLQLGCGGFCGRTDGIDGVTLDLQAHGCPRYESGEFVVAGGNGGHVGQRPVWALDPALVKDYAYEQEHQLTVVAKNVVELFYGQPPKVDYFSGCSGGGKQALNLAARYPNDFDGIVAGAPANFYVALFTFSMAWTVRANLAPDGSQILFTEDLTVLHEGALDACDDVDGLRDGLITDPRACEFDPGTLRCPDGRSDGCLTDAQIETARKIYRGAVDENGEPFYPGGGFAIGSENSWAFVRSRPDVRSGAEGGADGYLRYLAAPNQAKTYDWRTMSFDRATFEELTGAMTPIIDATDPDLREFRDHGGRLILWHGWNDGIIAPWSTIAYHEALRTVMGEGIGDFTRLFMVPGMYHCHEGDGPDEMDLITPLTDWVEHGTAPERIVVSEKDDGGAMVRTRPVFPYPQVPVYDGAGDPNDAASFRPATGRPIRR